MHDKARPHTVRDTDIDVMDWSQSLEHHLLYPNGNIIFDVGIIAKVKLATLIDQFSPNFL